MASILLRRLSRPGSKVGGDDLLNLFFLPEWALTFYLQRKVWRLPGKQRHTKQFHKQESPQAKERPNSWKQLKWYSVRESRPSLIILQCYVKKKKCRRNKAEIPTLKEEKAHRSYLWSNTWIVIYITAFILNSFHKRWQEQEISTCPKIYIRKKKEEKKVMLHCCIFSGVKIFF